MNFQRIMGRGYSFAPNLKIGVYKKTGLNESLVTIKLEPAEGE